MDVNGVEDGEESVLGTFSYICAVLLIVIENPRVDPFGTGSVLINVEPSV